MSQVTAACLRRTIYFFVLRRPIFAAQFYNEKLVIDVLKTGVKEWLRVHGDHV